jgi:formylglycine-generating enzyme
MKCHRTSGVVLVAVAIALAVSVAQAADVFNMPSGQTSLQFVTVGDPGNANDTAGSYRGAVAYTYQIGKYDVTVAQYCEFLNAVAATDNYGLYNTGMAIPPSSGWYAVGCGIARSGNSGSYSYEVTGNPDFPVDYVSWGSAARFCNWLQLGQPTGSEGPETTEAGAYTMDGATTNAALMAVTRNAGATYWIPTRDEWYKAAYYKGGGTNAGYWTYPTRSDFTPSNVLSETGTNNANFALGNGTGFTDPENYLTEVGAFDASPGPYGTYDVGGNIAQWNEWNLSDSYRGYRGGGFGNTEGTMKASSSYAQEPTFTGFIGMRIASVPEPGSLTLLLAGSLSLIAAAWRRGLLGG